VAREPVVIVGAGPVGLALGLVLRAWGVPARIHERRATPTTESRASHLHPRALEVFEGLGLAERMVSEGHPNRGAEIHGGSGLLASMRLDDLDSRWPFSLALPQSRVEALLREVFLARGGELVTDAEVLPSSAPADGRLVVRRAGREEVVEAEVIVGCDGGRSVVRDAIGAKLEGRSLPQTFVMGDFHDHPPGEVALLHTTPAGVLFRIPLADGWRVVADVGEGERDAPLRDLAAGRTGWDPGAPGWTSTFRMHATVADRWRVGRAFLAGDAAHLHTPVGAHGMNTGILDALDLGWKLGAVRTGLAGEGLLDAYAAERRPAAAASVRTAEALTRVLLLGGPLAAIRDAVMRATDGWGPLQGQLAAWAGELDVHVRGSAWVRDLPFTGWADASREEPSLAARLAFGRGPAAGERAPDVDLGGRWLLADLRGPRFGVLLFDGRDGTAGGYERAAAVAAAVEARLGERVAVRLVVPRAEAPPFAAAPVLADAEGRAHDRYGAATEAVFVVRPDGLVGYRAQPLDAEPLLDWLEVALGAAP
jgi:2-polyprenyl-6-methoxyphenol hydroxylase-like FAD-dependent oxidoreductase